MMENNNEEITSLMESLPIALCKANAIINWGWFYIQLLRKDERLKYQTKGHLLCKFAMDSIAGEKVSISKNDLDLGVESLKLLLNTNVEDDRQLNEKEKENQKKEISLTLDMWKQGIKEFYKIL